MPIAVDSLFDSNTGTFTKERKVFKFSQEWSLLLLEQTFVASMHFGNSWVIFTWVAIADKVLPAITEVAMNLCWLVFSVSCSNWEFDRPCRPLPHCVHIRML